MTDLYYQSWEWVEIQKEMHEEENAPDIMDEFNTPTTMQNYTISERLKLTLENIKHQENKVFWDDLEKLEEVLERVQELEKHFEEYQQIIGEETISRRSI
jgi:SpoVK/Ycf46/Vps4 family AAA+-type ATPase|tara:strand:+ start:578 stop:877 length:300 start_codon:yes stop_codon:yes gene_type:complete